MNRLRHLPAAASIMLGSHMRFKNIRVTGHTKQKSLIPTQLLYDFPPSLQQKRLYDSCKNVGHKHSRQLSVKTTKASMPFNSQTNSPSTSLAFCRQYHARFTNASWKLSGHWSHKTKRPHSNPVTLWPSSFSVAEEVLCWLQKCELLVTY